jgi:putative N6-adenine-specific DNA methylase
VHGRFKARDYDAMFDQCEALPWSEYIPEDGKVTIKPALSRSLSRCP